LTELPPTPGEVQDFASDASPDAVERLVDRILASPAYDERRGRHWLGVVRYADSDGFGIDSKRHTLWRYRDDVIRALNEARHHGRFSRVLNA